jgi:hypothetical protein
MSAMLSGDTLHGLTRPGPHSPNHTTPRRLVSGTAGTGRQSSHSPTFSIDVVGPMVSATVMMAVAANTGVARSARTE